MLSVSYTNERNKKFFFMYLLLLLETNKSIIIISHRHTYTTRTTIGHTY